MAEEYDAQRTHEYEAPVVREEIVEGVEVKDRGIFDFVGKKDGEEKEKETEHEHGHCHHHHGEEVIAAEFAEKTNTCEEEKLKGDEEEVEEKKKEKKEKKKKKHKLGGSDSSSSSSSDEEHEEKKNKDKKKEKKEKEEKKEEEKEEKRIEDTAVPVEKFDEEVVSPPLAEEKKGFLEKIKEKIPVGGHAKKSEEVTPPPPPPSDFEVAAVEVPLACNEGESIEKEKGFLGKIKEKIPVVGGHAKKSEEVTPPPPPPSDFEVAAVEVPPAFNEGESIEKEKKGFLEKIKEKIPGYHPKSHEEDKEKEFPVST